MKLEKIFDNLREGNGPVVLAAANFALGFGLGRLGKSVDEPIIPAILPATDIIFGTGLNRYTLFYAAGVALNYTQEIYQILDTM